MTNKINNKPKLDRGVYTKTQGVYYSKSKHNHLMENLNKTIRKLEALKNQGMYYNMGVEAEKIVEIGNKLNANIVKK